TRRSAGSIRARGTRIGRSCRRPGRRTPCATTGVLHPMVRFPGIRNNGTREETMRGGAMWLALAGLALARGAGGARAPQLKVLCSSGLREVMLELAPEFERASGHKLNLTFGLAAAFKQKIEAGEPFDVVVIVPALLDDVVKQGKVAGDSRA